MRHADYFTVLYVRAITYDARVMTQAPSAALSVVVVDDDATTAYAVCAMLEQEGHHAEARHQAMGTTGFILDRNPDIVLMDIEMPALSGPRLAAMLSERRCRARIALHSARPDGELAALAAGCGASGWIRKDGDHGALVERVEQAARGWRQP